MMNKVLFTICYSEIANTGHHSGMFSSVVYNNIQKITNISIKKPIILILILNKYLDIPIYLDNCTPLLPYQLNSNSKCNVQLKSPPILLCMNIQPSGACLDINTAVDCLGLFLYNIYVWICHLVVYVPCTFAEVL